MGDTATLTIDGQSYDFPVVVGSEQECGIDITTLRKKTGYITLDSGYMNTGACTSDITFIDGEKGILRYHGIPIEQVAEHSSFVETCYLLQHGQLPNQEQLTRFSGLLNEFSQVHEGMRQLLNFFPLDAHPMNILGSLINALSSFYPHVSANSMTEEIDISAARLISKVRTLAAYSYRKANGLPVVYPRHDMSYTENFLNMMFSSTVSEYTPDADDVRLMDMLLIMHAEHEQNCSTSAVRLVGSSQANLYASISSGISALWGPLHGGANQAVMNMLNKIKEDGGNTSKYIEMAKDKTNNFRLSGFGHRVYKNYDPRALVIKKYCTSTLEKGAANDPLLEIAMRLEEEVLADDYFIERKLFPNVDFYSGIIYKALGFPTDMFTVLFAIGRMPGWIAQWKEMVNAPDARIGRPRQIYTGATERDYVPMAERM
jgi:citrate synthase